jgi:hypothetical protein
MHSKWCVTDILATFQPHPGMDKMGWGSELETLLLCSSQGFKGVKFFWISEFYFYLDLVEAGY